MFVCFICFYFCIKQMRLILFEYWCCVGFLGSESRKRAKMRKTTFRDLSPRVNARSQSREFHLGALSETSPREGTRRAEGMNSRGCPRLPSAGKYPLSRREEHAGLYGKCQQLRTRGKKPANQKERTRWTFRDFILRERARGNELAPSPNSRLLHNPWTTTHATRGILYTLLSQH